VANKEVKTLPQWHVNGQGQTMVVIPGPVEFIMGSPSAERDRLESEVQHKKRIGRTFAMAAKAVTVEQYRRFHKKYAFTEKYAPTPDCPIIGTTWYRAAAYCNWLSEQEGIDPKQWCYEIEPEGATNPDVKIVGLKKNYLQLEGYRLPTEPEIEYATRAGSLTSRYYGETEELLPKYAWDQTNSKGQTWPVGSLKPNDLGLFDMQGNSYAWCQEKFEEYETRMPDDTEHALEIRSTEGRVLRGGSFMLPGSSVRSANRNHVLPAVRDFTIGFRVARTIAP
jgi:formylglycine-generating enzyme required for sulfatase activity